MGVGKWHKSIKSDAEICSIDLMGNSRTRWKRNAQSPNGWFNVLLRRSCKSSMRWGLSRRILHGQSGYEYGTSKLLRHSYLSRSSLHLDLFLCNPSPFPTNEADIVIIVIKCRLLRRYCAIYCNDRHQAPSSSKILCQIL